MNAELTGRFRPLDRAWSVIARLWNRGRALGPRTVDLHPHGILTIDVTGDFTGDTCLRTNLVTKMMLDNCAPSAVIEIATDNLASVETIPFMLPSHGCVHIATVRSETGWIVYARKEEGPRCSR